MPTHVGVDLVHSPSTGEWDGGWQTSRRPPEAYRVRRSRRPGYPSPRLRRLLGTALSGSGSSPGATEDELSSRDL